MSASCVGFVMRTARSRSRPSLNPSCLAFGIREVGWREEGTDFGGAVEAAALKIALGFGSAAGGSVCRAGRAARPITRSGHTQLRALGPFVARREPGRRKVWLATKLKRRGDAQCGINAFAQGCMLGTECSGINSVVASRAKAQNCVVRPVRLRQIGTRRSGSSAI